MMYEHEGQQAALDAIDAAPLSAPVYRTARRLLDLANAEGYCHLSAAELLALCATDSEGTVRHHLGRLREANLIESTSRRMVAVRFVDFHPHRPAQTGRYGRPTRATAPGVVVQIEPVVTLAWRGRKYTAVAHE